MTIGLREPDFKDTRSETKDHSSFLDLDIGENKMKKFITSLALGLALTAFVSAQVGIEERQAAVVQVPYYNNASIQYCGFMLPTLIIINFPGDPVQVRELNSFRDNQGNIIYLGHDIDQRLWAIRPL